MGFMLAATGAWAQRVTLDEQVLMGLELQSPDTALAVAFRYAPGPQGVAVIIIDPESYDPAADEAGRVPVRAMYLYVPDHPDWSTPRRLAMRSSGSAYTFQNVRLSTNHDGRDHELVLAGNLRSVVISRYLQTSALTLRGWFKLTGVKTIQGSTGRARFQVSADTYLSEGQMRDRTLTPRNFTAAPSMDFRAMEGGRMVVANLTLCSRPGRARSWVYFFPLQNADSQIRVDALDARGAVIETIQLRTTRGDFDSIDTWTGRFRRLQTGQSYTLRATVDLGLLGQLEETLPVTIFDF